MRRAPGLVLFAAAVLAGRPAVAVEDYDACIALVASAPERAVIEAGEWARFGGGAGARHCYALALLAVGSEVRGADELIAIAAEEADLPAETRAAMLVQAGETLLAVGDVAAARSVAGEALRLDPEDVDAVGLSASASIAAGNAPVALDELNRALSRNARMPQLLILRAAALRRQGQLVAARDDAEFATELAPELADAWLERGRVAAELGDRPGARKALMRAIELDRAGSAGAAARLSLQRMEAGLSQ